MIVTQISVGKSSQHALFLSLQNEHSTSVKKRLYRIKYSLLIVLMLFFVIHG